MDTTKKQPINSAEAGKALTTHNTSPGVDVLEVPEVTWYKDPGLRKLYALLPICFLGTIALLHASTSTSH